MSAPMTIKAILPESPSVGCAVSATLPPVCVAFPVFTASVGPEKNKGKVRNDVKGIILSYDEYQNRNRNQIYTQIKNI